MYIYTYRYTYRYIYMYIYVHIGIHTHTPCSAHLTKELCQTKNTVNSNC